VFNSHFRRQGPYKTDNTKQVAQLSPTEPRDASCHWIFR